MRALMISLDKGILHAGTPVANRMLEYGKSGALDIIIPTEEKTEINLSANVRVFGTGGKKWQQFWRVIFIGKKLTKTNVYDLVTAQDPFMTAFCAWCARGKAKLEIQVHGDFFGGTYRQARIKNLFYYWLARWFTLSRADTVRVVGERVKKSLITLGINPDKIEVKPVPLDANFIRVHKPEKNVKEELRGFGKYFVYAGRLEKEKNVAWLIKIFDQYLRETNSQDLLVILGEGSEKDYLRNLVKELQHEKEIKFKGWSSNPLDYIKTADCVLIPSEAEGYGLVAMEAAAAGTKLIMTDVGVANYELPPNENVRIVPVGDAAAFIAAMQKI